LSVAITPSLFTILTMGTFDGVHLGHQKIVNRVIEESRKSNAISVAVTFDIHPANLLSHTERPRLLTSLQNKKELFKRLGIGVMAIVRFDKRVSNMQPRDFIRNVIVKKLSPKSIIVGKDFRFGKHRKGDLRLLRNLGKRYCFSLYVIGEKRLFGNKVSSRYIRKILWRGEVEKATRLLGRPYSINGRVVKGSGLGNILGYPTANIHISENFILPQGIYSVKVLLGRREYRGVSYIGFKPTFPKKDTGRREISIETHLLNFNRDILGRNITVFFYKKLGKERKLKNPNRLKARIERYIEKAGGAEKYIS